MSSLDPGLTRGPKLVDMTAAAGLVAGFAARAPAVVLPAQDSDDSVAALLFDFSLAEGFIPDEAALEAMAAYVVPSTVDEAPVLLAQASRGGSSVSLSPGAMTDSPGNGVAASRGGVGLPEAASDANLAADAPTGARTAAQGEDDNKVAVGWWPALGGLALLGGGGGGSSPNSPVDGRTSLDLANYSYTLPTSNPVTTSIGFAGGSTGKVGYPGKESEFGFTLTGAVQVEGNPNPVVKTLVFSLEKQLDESYLATFAATGNPTLYKTIDASVIDSGNFANVLKGVLTDLAVAGSISLSETNDGTTTSFSFLGFTVSMALDNSIGNGNLINSLAVSFTGGSFQISSTVDPVFSYIDFAVGSDAFPAGTYLVDDEDVAAFVADPLMEGEYAVVVNDAFNPYNIDMSPDGDGGIPGVQVQVVDSDGALVYATLSSQPTTYEQLFAQNNYVLYV